MTGLPLNIVVANWRPWDKEHSRTWLEHSQYLWDEEYEYMVKFREAMIEHGWVAGPVDLGWDGLIWNGHHRIVLCIGLGWDTHPIPVVYKHKE